MGEVTDIRSHRTTYTETPTFRSILALAGLCHERLRLGIVTGGAGVGKTFALKHYCETTPFARYIRLERAHGHKTAGMTHLYRSLGGSLEWRHRDGGPLYEALAERIETDFERDPYFEKSGAAEVPVSRPLMVIDEAQNATFDLLEVLRDLYDERSIGLLIAGNDDFRSLLNSRQGRLQYAPLRDRAIKPILNIPHPTADDVAAIAAHHRIADQRCHALLARVAAGHGLRTIVDDVIGEARHLAGAGKAIETRHIEAAIQNCQL